MRHQHSVYLCRVFDQKRLVKSAKKHLRYKRYDVMIGTGLSGALSIPLLAYVLNKRFAILRKDRSNSHGTFDLEGDIRPGDRWIFVDDFICSGDTKRRVIDAVKKRTRAYFPIKYVGMYLYSDSSLDERFISE